MMSGDDLFAEIEERLRNEADALLDRRAPSIPLEPLRTRYRRACRRRRVLRTLAWLAPVLALAAALAAWQLPTGREPPPDGSIAQSLARPISPAEAPALDEPAVAGTDHGQSDAAVQAAVGNGVEAIPIVIIRFDGERESIIPGILVPGHEVPLEIHDLSPVEQRAVRRVLDLDAGGGQVDEAI
jgi:hypothetical protein